MVRQIGHGVKCDIKAVESNHGFTVYVEYGVRGERPISEFDRMVGMVTNKETGEQCLLSGLDAVVGEANFNTFKHGHTVSYNFMVKGPIAPTRIEVAIHAMVKTNYDALSTRGGSGRAEKRTYSGTRPSDEIESFDKECYIVPNGIGGWEVLVGWAPENIVRFEEALKEYKNQETKETTMTAGNSKLTKTQEYRILRARYRELQGLISEMELQESVYVEDRNNPNRKKLLDALSVKLADAVTEKDSLYSPMRQARNEIDFTDEAEKKAVLNTELSKPTSKVSVSNLKKVSDVDDEGIPKVPPQKPLPTNDKKPTEASGHEGILARMAKELHLVDFYTKIYNSAGAIVNQPYELHHKYAPKWALDAQQKLFKEMSFSDYRTNMKNLKKSIGDRLELDTKTYTQKHPYTGTPKECENIEDAQGNPLPFEEWPANCRDIYREWSDKMTEEESRRTITAGVRALIIRERLGLTDPPYVTEDHWDLMRRWKDSNTGRVLKYEHSYHMANDPCYPPTIGIIEQAEGDTGVSFPLCRKNAAEGKAPDGHYGILDIEGRPEDDNPAPHIFVKKLSCIPYGDAKCTSKIEPKRHLLYVQWGVTRGNSHFNDHKLIQDLGITEFEVTAKGEYLTPELGCTHKAVGDTIIVNPKDSFCAVSGNLVDNECHYISMFWINHGSPGGGWSLDIKAVGGGLLEVNLDIVIGLLSGWANVVDDDEVVKLMQSGTTRPASFQLLSKPNAPTEIPEEVVDTPRGMPPSQLLSDIRGAITWHKNPSNRATANYKRRFPAKRYPHGYAREWEYLKKLLLGGPTEMTVGYVKEWLAWSKETGLTWEIPRLEDAINYLEQKGGN